MITVGILCRMLVLIRQETRVLSVEKAFYVKKALTDIPRKISMKKLICKTCEQELTVCLDDEESLQKLNTFLDEHEGHKFIFEKDVLSSSSIHLEVQGASEIENEDRPRDVSTGSLFKEDRAFISDSSQLKICSTCRDSERLTKFYWRCILCGSKYRMWRNKK